MTTFPHKSLRFAQFIQKLHADRPATSREDAVTLMKHVMKTVEDSYGLPPGDFGHRMNVFSLDTGMGWKDLDSDPCYWDDALAQTHRTQIFHTGQIVITRIKEPIVLVLDKPGGR